MAVNRCSTIQEGVHHARFSRPGGGDKPTAGTPSSRPAPPLLVVAARSARQLSRSISDRAERDYATTDGDQSGEKSIDYPYIRAGARRHQRAGQRSDPPFSLPLLVPRRSLAAPATLGAAGGKAAPRAGAAALQLATRAAACETLWTSFVRGAHCHAPSRAARTRHHVAFFFRLGFGFSTEFSLYSPHRKRTARWTVPVPHRTATGPYLKVHMCSAARFLHCDPSLKFILQINLKNFFFWKFTLFLGAKVIGADV